MENKKPKLMEMVETEEGFALNNLTPFFLHNHVYEILEMSKIALKVYTEMEKIVSLPYFKNITHLQPDDIAIFVYRIKAEIGISEETIEYLYNHPRSFNHKYSPLIEIYQGVVNTLENFAKKQKEINEFKISD